MKLSAQTEIFSHVSLEDKLLFAKHLALMLQTGIPIAEAFETLSEQTKSTSFHTLLTSVQKDLQNGQTLAKSLAKHPNIFNHFYISLIQVGEESGTLEQNLSFLSEQLGKESSLRKKIQGALMYPLMIFIAASILGLAIALFVLPKLLDLFKNFNVELPLSTKILLFVAELMKNYGILIISAVIAFAVGFMLFLQLPVIRPLWHRFSLMLPVAGKIVATTQLAFLCRNLSTRLKSGIPINRALTVTAATLGNVSYQRGLTKTSESVVKGKPFASALATFPFLFSPLMIKMIAVGEKTGKLEEVLLYLSDYYEEEIDETTKNLTTILEPFLLIAIGGFVAFIALSIITPIYEFTGSITK